jgi:hypothetical protein
MKNVLIAEKDSFTRHTLASLLECRNGLLNVLTAASVKAALAAAAAQPIQVVVIGPGLSETSCHRLITRLPARNPGTRIFLIEKKASPKLSARIIQAHPGVQIVRAQQVGLLIERILSILRIAYGGRISGISLPGFLQMTELEGCTCTLRINAADKTGYLGIRNGTPVTANVAELRGTAAVLQILGWSNASIELDYTPPERPPEITTPLMGLLLESGRLADEKAAAQPDQRAHKRYDCPLTVDCAFGNRIDPCDLRDIGLGGACIQTRQPVSIGQKITLILSDPNRVRGCAVSGRIIRHASRQTALRFDSISLQQEKAIQKLVAVNGALEKKLDFSLTDLPIEAA